MRQLHAECTQIRLKAVENEPRKVQLVQGVSFKDDNQVIYDDTIVLNFNHPTDSSIAAIHSVEELHGEVTDAEAVAKLQSLSLPNLTKEQRENLDMNDIDLYERKQEELKLIKDLITDNIKKGNRYAYPFMVLDTDYDKFLVTYQCREEFRKPLDTDYMLVDGERYREVIEEYNSDKHDHYIADRTISNHEENSAFQKLQRRLFDDNEKKELTDDDYNQEIDTLMAIDPLHRHHFNSHRPTIEQWKKRRSLYVDTSFAELDDAFNMEKESWFNDLRITVYFRDHTVADNELEDIKLKIKQRVPGFDFDTFQLNTIHDESTCIQGNIFSHSNSWRYT